MKGIKDARGSRFLGSVKVGPKGQIVIPKEVRDMFNIQPGDTMLVLADADKGIAIERYGLFAKIADSIFAGHARELYPEQSESDSLHFAQAIRDVGEEEEQDGNGNQNN